MQELKKEVDASDISYILRHSSTMGARRIAFSLGIDFQLVRDIISENTNSGKKLNYQLPKNECQFGRIISSSGVIMDRV